MPEANVHHIQGILIMSSLNTFCMHIYIYIIFIISTRYRHRRILPTLTGATVVLLHLVPPEQSKTYNIPGFQLVSAAFAFSQLRIYACYLAVALTQDTLHCPSWPFFCSVALACLMRGWGSYSVSPLVWKPGIILRSIGTTDWCGIADLGRPLLNDSGDFLI